MRERTELDFGIEVMRAMPAILNIGRPGVDDARLDGAIDSCEEKTNV